MDYEKLNEAKKFFSNVDSDLLLSLLGDYARDLGRILATGEGDYEYTSTNYQAVYSVLRERLEA